MSKADALTRENTFHIAIELLGWEKERYKMVRTEKPLSNFRIGFTGKGGAGKSTVLVLLAKALAHRGYDVCVVDADSTNVGLHQALKIADPPSPLLDYFGGMVFSGGAVTCPVDDPTLLDGAHIQLGTLPERYYARAADGILLLSTGKLGDKGPGAGCDGPLVKIARDLDVSDIGAHPVTLIDFKAGFEDSARGAITTLDYAIVVVDPTQAAIQMAIHMDNLVNAIQAGELPATEHLERLELVEIANRLYTQARIDRILVVLNKVADAESESYMRQKLADAGISPLGVIHQDDAITRAWLRGAPVDEGSSIAGWDAELLVSALESYERIELHHV